MMRQLKETPKSLVQDGKVTQWGIFNTPFQNMNILETSLPGVPDSLTKYRIKEWQHYAIISEKFLFTFVVVDPHYMGTSFCYFLGRNGGPYHEHHRESIGQASRVSRELWKDTTIYERKGYSVRIDNLLEQGFHRATINIDKTKSVPAIHAELEILEDLTRVQPLIPVLPISENRPLHTHKAPCPVRGVIRVGSEKYELTESSDLALIDVQKTFYPYNTQWNWATFAGYDRKGKMLAINLVQNMITDDETYNENCLWVNGKLTLWGAARFFIDETDLMKPWRMKTTDGNCDLTFTPEGERAGRINMGVIMSDYHQPYGTYQGVVKDAQGVPYEVDGLFGVTERHMARF